MGLNFCSMFGYFYLFFCFSRLNFVIEIVIEVVAGGLVKSTLFISGSVGF